MTRLLALLVSSLLAAQGLAEPFEKLFEVPEGELISVVS
jgi:tripeptidyl-peptidase-1